MARPTGQPGLSSGKRTTLGNAPEAVFIPYDRLDAVIAMMRPPSTPKLVE